MLLAGYFHFSKDLCAKHMLPVSNYQMVFTLMNIGNFLLPRNAFVTLTLYPTKCLEHSHCADE